MLKKTCGADRAKTPRCRAPKPGTHADGVGSLRAPRGQIPRNEACLEVRPNKPVPCRARESKEGNAPRQIPA